MKLVSIIMGIYNCEDTLEEAIDSIIRQSYTNWELIMCDDGSVDNTYEIAKSYADKYPQQIFLLKNEKNMKLAYTLNKCLGVAKGEYIARMDGDDISLSERFEKQVKYLDEHVNIQVVGTGMQRFSEDGLGATVFAPDKPNKYTMRNEVPFFHATIMMRKSTYDDLGGYLVSKYTQRSQDWELWFRFFAKGFVGENIHEALYKVREDKNAVKRRSFKSRCQTIKSTIIGYKMLDYPWFWYIKPILGIFKGLVPSSIVLLYRERQKNI